MPAILQHKALSGLPTFSFHNFHVNSAIISVNTKSTERPNFCRPQKHGLLSSVNSSTSRVNKLKSRIKWFLLLSLWMKTSQMKATAQYFPMVLFVKLYKTVLHLALKG